MELKVVIVIRVRLVFSLTSLSRFSLQRRACDLIRVQ